MKKSSASKFQNSARSRTHWQRAVVENFLSAGNGNSAQRSKIHEEDDFRIKMSKLREVSNALVESRNGELFVENENSAQRSKIHENDDFRIKDSKCMSHI